MENLSYSVATHKGANCFKWHTDSKAEFRYMRGYLLAAHGPENRCFVSDLVNKIDDLYDLKVGETMYFALSEYMVYTNKNLDRLAEDVSYFEQAMSNAEHPEKYKARSQGFCIKRTNKLFVYRAIWEDYSGIK